MTSTTAHTVRFVGGKQDGRMIHTPSGLSLCRYRDEEGKPLADQLGDQAFCWGPLDGQPPQRYYQRRYTGYGFEAAYVHATLLNQWEAADFDVRHAVLQHRRTAPVVVAPQQSRGADPVATGDHHRPDTGQSRPTGELG